MQNVGLQARLLDWCCIQPGLVTLDTNLAEGSRTHSDHYDLTGLTGL